MNAYVTGTTIRNLRESRNMTQAELGERIGVSSKTISKWETGKGLPDISLLSPLAQALGISLIELMNGAPIQNKNISANLLRSKFYVCPLCGNCLHSTGNALEDEHFLTIHHPMTKQHFISFAAFVTCDRIQMVKFYPEGNAETRMQLRGMGTLYYYCNRHGLFKQKI